MKGALFLVGLAMLAVLSGCATVRTSYSYDKNVDFRQFRCYDWRYFSQDQQIDELTAIRLKTAIDKELHSKGFIRTSNSPDFLVFLYGYTEILTDAVEWGPKYYEFHTYWRFEKGTFFVDFIDRYTRNLIWRGNLKTLTDTNLGPDNRFKRANTAAYKLLANFPPT